MVRAAVLKMKDPTQILEELQKIDEMGIFFLEIQFLYYLYIYFKSVYCFISEYNVLQPSPLNEKVLKEKRKKLKETFDRVLKMYVSINLMV